MAVQVPTLSPGMMVPSQDKLLGGMPGMPGMLLMHQRTTRTTSPDTSAPMQLGAAPLAGLVPPATECDLFDPQGTWPHNRHNNPFDTTPTGELFGEADLNSWLREAVDNDPLRDWMEPPMRYAAPCVCDPISPSSSNSAEGDGANSDQDSVPALATTRRRRAGGMSRAISMPNVMLAGKPPSPTLPLPKIEGPITSESLLPTATSAPLGMPRSLSSGCLLSAANGAPFPIPTTPINAPPAPPLTGNGFLTAQAVMAAPSTVPAGVGPPTAVWHAQMGLTPRRKGKGGRQPANDPRLDPTVDPKKARRIVANRISAAKSKLKQKSEIEVLRAQLSEVTGQRDALQQQVDAVQRHCQGLEDHNKQLQNTVQVGVKCPVLIRCVY